MLGHCEHFTHSPHSITPPPCHTPTPPPLSSLPPSNNHNNKQYTSYSVTTTPQDWEVRRRYSEFGWLRSMLLQRYPGMFVPTIPSKVKAAAISSEKRMYLLGCFLDQVGHRRRNNLHQPEPSLSLFLSSYPFHSPTQLLPACGHGTPRRRRGHHCFPVHQRPRRVGQDAARRKQPANGAHASVE